MPILPTVGRRSPKIVGAILLIYVMLCVGGVTMVYPFMVTLTGSVSNAFDHERYSAVPRWVFDTDEQFLKFAAEKYDKVFVSNFALFASAYDAPKHWGSLKDVAFEKDVVGDYYPWIRSYEQHIDAFRQRAEDYQRFMRTYPRDNCLPMFYRQTSIKYQAYLKERFEKEYLASQGLTHWDGSALELEQKSLELMNDTFQEGVSTSYSLVTIDTFIMMAYHLQGFFRPSRPKFAVFADFMEHRLGPFDMTPVTGKYLWNWFLFQTAPVIDKLNDEWGLRDQARYKSVWMIPYWPRRPANPAIARYWDRFHRDRFPLRLIELEPDQAQPYRRYLEKRFGTIDRYNGLCETHYKSFAAIPFCNRAPSSTLERNFWVDYVKRLPRKHKIFHSPEGEYQRFLRLTYASIADLNRAYHTTYTNWDDVQIDIPRIDYQHFRENRAEYVWLFATFNFTEVFRFMSTRGRALLNTVVLVSLTILVTLTVNPLAAYALSRFHLRSTQAILIFLLATMAFPPAVSMIPAFLLLRDLGLLNTYAALILPRLANGFAIFLLKGFFDSLPRELYEAAAIDGAGEWVMFSQITIPLCKPILAVMVLSAFVAAYSGFMWAFIVCQDKKMWTLMVWLYQFNQLYKDAPWMFMAALVLASIPTLLLFIFCQKIILRGIIIPSMK